VRPKIGVRLVPLWATVIVAGYLVYNLFPAIGPVYAFSKSYPWAPVVLASPSQPMLSASDAPRNCMPSIHLALALLVWWNSRGRHWWARGFAGGYLLATVIATLGLGEHYVADLIVAVPFSLTFQAMWTATVPFAKRERYGTVLTGGTLLIMWLMVLRYGMDVLLRLPMFSWGLTALTLLLCGWLNFRLARAAEGPGTKFPTSLKGVATQSKL